MDIKKLFGAKVPHAPASTDESDAVVSQHNSRNMTFYDSNIIKQGLVALDANNRASRAG